MTALPFKPAQLSVVAAAFLASVRRSGLVLGSDWPMMCHPGPGDAGPLDALRRLADVLNPAGLAFQDPGRVGHLFGAWREAGGVTSPRRLRLEAAVGLAVAARTILWAWGLEQITYADPLPTVHPAALPPLPVALPPLPAALVDQIECCAEGVRTGELVRWPPPAARRQSPDGLKAEGYHAAAGSAWVRLRFVRRELDLIESTAARPGRTRTSCT